MAFFIHSYRNLLYLTAPQLEAQAGVVHGFSTRTGGISKPPFDTLNLGTTRGDDHEAVMENFRRYCSAIGTNPDRNVPAVQVHGDVILQVTVENAGRMHQVRDYEADGLVTNVRGVPLSIFSADCGILLLFDPVTRCIGVCHSGWRGCALGIVEKTVQTLTKCYGADPANILAAIGPGIGPCCFETDGDVPDALQAALGTVAEPYIDRCGTKYHVDLPGLNALWLRRAGLPSDHIERCDLCTACHPSLFWSHRKMGEQRGLQAGMIALR